jgi:maltose alpha-D-glucosyltransferase/alpha-amylase
MELLQSLKKYWDILYPEQPDDKLKAFIAEIEATKKTIIFQPHDQEWYKDAVVYSLYVDAFHTDFNGLMQKLDYLQELGVNCLWLLPILDSPMKDAGFDIRNYDQIRADLLGLPKDSSLEEQQQFFRDFLEKAHNRGIKVIFDIAINHTSEEHPWFVESRKSEDNPYRDYYIWSKDTSLYKDARIIFEGLCESNWEPDGEWNYFHRFFEFQPDLNFRNPDVLLDMTRNFLFWLTQGVDGFRADAIPYLWKEDGTTCENHPMTHTVVKFFRTVLDYIRPHTLLLAEACQKPNEVVKYFGDGDECNAGYHFPLMPQIFKSLASGNNKAVENILSPAVTPQIPDAAQWFTFLRCHDELSLELVYVSEEDRKYIHDNYCHEPLWDFRLGQGVAARLSELMQRDPAKIGLAYSIMLSLPGTPIIYYGDEFGKLNDQEYYKEQIKLTGKDDTRFLVRGPIDWEQLEKELKFPDSLSTKIYKQVKKLVNTRNKYNVFGRGEINWIKVLNQEEKAENRVLGYTRSFEGKTILIINNLSGKSLWVKSDLIHPETKTDILGHKLKHGKEAGHLEMNPYEYLWIEI